MGSGQAAIRLPFYRRHPPPSDGKAGRGWDEPPSACPFHRHLALGRNARGMALTAAAKTVPRPATANADVQEHDGAKDDAGQRGGATAAECEVGVEAKTEAQPAMRTRTRTRKSTTTPRTMPVGAEALAAEREVGMEARPQRAL